MGAPPPEGDPDVERDTLAATNSLTRRRGYHWGHLGVLFDGGKRRTPFKDGGVAYARATTPQQLADALLLFREHPGPALIRCLLPQDSTSAESVAVVKALRDERELRQAEVVAAAARATRG